MKAPGPGDALIVVDIQNDFLPGGALGVPEGDAVVAPLNHLIDAWAGRGLPIYFTRDWHPAGHCSFAARGGQWPPHCVQDTAGAEFAPALHRPKGAHVVSKGTRRDEEAYSTFHGTSLERELRATGVTRVFIGGLATDYCVRFSGSDAIHAGFDVVVLEDACRAVNVHAGDGERALQELDASGAELESTWRVLDSMGAIP